MTNLPNTSTNPVQDDQANVPMVSPSVSHDSARDAEPQPVRKPSPPEQQISVGGPNKEIFGGISASFSELIKPVESAKDMELPKEVAAAGVKQTPTQIKVPPILKQAGVKPAGINVMPGTGKSIVLPLSDQQIADGLKKSVSDSIRWLAEWCRRKLLQIGKKLPTK